MKATTLLLAALLLALPHLCLSDTLNIDTADSPVSGTTTSNNTYFIYTATPADSTVSLQYHPRVALRAEKRLRMKQRALARCQRRSRRREKRKREVARLHRKVANARATYLHQISARLA